MTEKKQIIHILDRAFQCKYNSLAAYILSAKPFVKDGEEGLVCAIEEVAAEDKRQMELSYADPSWFDHKRLLPGTSLEFQRPTFADAAGFLIAFAICFAIVGLAILLAGIGG